jgi:hypothetical protein
MLTHTKLVYSLCLKDNKTIKMKKQFLLQNLFLLLLGIIGISADAQRRKNCGTVKTDTAFLLSMASREQNPAYRIENTTRMLNVFIHILYDDNGTAAAITMQRANEEFASLVADYSSNNMCFFLAGVDTIHDTDLNVFFNVDDDNPNEFDPYQVPNCLNVFYVQRIQGTNTSCASGCGIGGIALGGIPGTFCLVDDGNVGDHTIAHEIGHCLGLSHTFSRINGRECINGSNSAIAGDLILDTNADPFSFDGASCYSESTNSCGTSYTGDCEDPCGDRNYSPPYLNLMSYWDHCSAQSFTPYQFIRVNGTVDNYAPVAICASPSSYTQNSITVSSGYFIKAAINSLSTSGNVTISSSAIATLGGSSVTLASGFHADPSGSGSTTIKITSCN